METIEFKEKTVYIVGTGHVFRKSVNEVRAAIKEVKPDVVAVELDLPRFLNRNKKPKPNFNWDFSSPGTPLLILMLPVPFLYIIFRPLSPHYQKTTRPGSF